MKKLSEILRIASKHHVGFGGRIYYMCGALTLAANEREITEKECELVQNFCMDIVDCVDDCCCFLRSALRERDLPHDDDTLFLIYSAVIDKLESEGK